jgi:ABC-type uncharacterized transport system permease subunit
VQGADRKNLPVGLLLAVALLLAIAIVLPKSGHSLRVLEQNPPAAVRGGKE